MKTIYLTLLFSTYTWMAAAQSIPSGVYRNHAAQKERIYIRADAYIWNDDITYFDGFNRPLQEIQVNGSASTQSDLVTPHVYVAFGQEEKKYLPFVKQHNSGAFVTDALNVTNWNTYGTDEWLMPSARPTTKHRP